MNALGLPFQQTRAADEIAPLGSRFGSRLNLRDVSRVFLAEGQRQQRQGHKQKFQLGRPRRSNAGNCDIDCFRVASVKL